MALDVVRTGTFMPLQDLAISPDPPPDLLYLLYTPREIGRSGGGSGKIARSCGFLNTSGCCFATCDHSPCNICHVLARCASAHLPSGVSEPRKHFLRIRASHLGIRSRASGNSEPRLQDVEHNQPDLEVFAHGTTRNVLTVTQTGARATTKLVSNWFDLTV